jgi:hypothetical protein
MTECSRGTQGTACAARFCDMARMASLLPLGAWRSPWKKKDHGGTPPAANSWQLPCPITSNFRFLAPPHDSSRTMISVVIKLTNGSFQPPSLNKPRNAGVPPEASSSPIHTLLQASPA